MTAPPVIAFDGVCVLCHGFVRFMLNRDTAARFRFASTASAAGAGSGPIGTTCSPAARSGQRHDSEVRQSAQDL